jgi:hypothetical protein
MTKKNMKIIYIKKVFSPFYESDLSTKYKIFNDAITKIKRISKDYMSIVRLLKIGGLFFLMVNLKSLVFVASKYGFADIGWTLAFYTLIAQITITTVLLFSANKIITIPNTIV